MTLRKENPHEGEGGKEKEGRIVGHDPSCDASKKEKRERVPRHHSRLTPYRGGLTSLPRGRGKRKGPPCFFIPALPSHEKRKEGAKEERRTFSSFTKAQVATRASRRGRKQIIGFSSPRSRKEKRGGSTSGDYEGGEGVRDYHSHLPGETPTGCLVERATTEGEVNFSAKGKKEGGRLLL